MTPEFDIPKYVSHKEVWAAEIEKIDIYDRVTISFKDCKPLNYIISEYDKMVIRYQPTEGDFLIIYPDGYQSFSPRKAFLDGYTKL
jgi:hypothetical protein